MAHRCILRFWGMASIKRTSLLRLATPSTSCIHWWDDVKAQGINWSRISSELRRRWVFNQKLSQLAWNHCATNRSITSRSGLLWVIWKRDEWPMFVVENVLQKLVDGSYRNFQSLRYQRFIVILVPLELASFAQGLEPRLMQCMLGSNNSLKSPASFCL